MLTDTEITAELSRLIEESSVLDVLLCLADLIREKYPEEAILVEQAANI